MTEPLLTFSGAVHCRRSAEPLGLTLSGTAAGTPAEETLLAFSARAPGELPHELADVAVERGGLTPYRDGSGRRGGVIEAAAGHLPRAGATPFHAAIPPRPGPRGGRVLRGAAPRASARPAG